MWFSVPIPGILQVELYVPFFHFPSGFLEERRTKVISDITRNIYYFKKYVTYKLLLLTPCHPLEFVFCHGKTTY